MPEDGLLSAMLNKAGLCLKDVTLINVNFTFAVPDFRARRCCDWSLSEFGIESDGYC